MGVLIALLLLFVVGVALLGAAGGLALFGYGERARRKSEENAPAILDAAFDGSPRVTFKVTMESPSYETVVRGAEDRGYRLAHETNDTADGVARTLLFDRV